MHKKHEIVDEIVLGDNIRAQINNCPMIYIHEVKTKVISSIIEINEALSTKIRLSNDIQKYCTTFKLYSSSLTQEQTWFYPHNKSSLVGVFNSKINLKIFIDDYTFSLIGFLNLDERIQTNYEHQEFYFIFNGVIGDDISLIPDPDYSSIINFEAWEQTDLTIPIGDAEMKIGGVTIGRSIETKLNIRKETIEKFIFDRKITF